MRLSLKQQNRQGSILALVLFVAISLTILSLSYFKMMRAARNTDQRLGQQFVAREIALLLREEATVTIQRDCRDQRSQIFGFLLGGASGAQMEMRSPLSGENIGRLLQPGFACEFSSKLQVVSFINYDHRNHYYPSTKEGHGIMAIQIEVSLLDERTGQKSAVIKENLHTQYDYLVAATLCLDNHESKLRQPLLLRHDRQVFDQYSSLQIEEGELKPTIEENPADFKLYDRITLWSARNLSRADLSGRQIIDEERKIINLSGIYHCSEPLNFAGDWQIKGKGVIIADSFSISGALKKAGDEDILVLYARKGKIVVNTPQKIEAALVAINDNHSGTIEAKKPLQLSGMLVADYLNLNEWSNNTHKISFDKALLAADKTYQISVSPWTNFRSGASS